MKVKKLMAWSTAAALLLCSGCGGNTGDSKVKNEPIGDSYPLNTSETLTFWTGLPLHPDYQSPSEQPQFKGLMEKTGVNIDFKVGQSPEAFNLMLASGDMADMVMYQWYKLPGGPEKYINDQTILELNDLIDQYSPNLKQYLAEHPEIDKLVKTDSGKYYVYPDIKEDDELCAYFGPAVRSDLLAKYGLEEPETIDEWHTMLKTFKDNGVKTPLSFYEDGHNVFAAAFNVAKDFYLNDDGKVTYGPAEEGWRQYLTTMKQWYEEGLLDNDLGALDRSLVTGKVTSGAVGATAGFLAGDMGRWLESGKAINPEFDMVGTKYPVLEKGSKPEFSVKQNYYDGGTFNVAITSKCKNPELAARFLDFGYTEEGILFYNFGIEGESYDMVDGKPVFRESFFNTESGESDLSKYSWKTSGAPSILMPEMYNQRLKFQQQKDALVTWSDSEMSKHLMPTIIYNEEESEIDSQCLTNIQTHVDEMNYKFILGNRPIEEFDQFVEELKQMGLDDLIAAKQSALERYQNR